MTDKLRALLLSRRAEEFRYGPDKPLVVLRAQWPVDRALRVLLKHNITAAVRVAWLVRTFLSVCPSALGLLLNVVLFVIRLIIFALLLRTVSRYSDH